MVDFPTGRIRGNPRMSDIRKYEAILWTAPNASDERSLEISNYMHIHSK